jgi:glycosyltransferase involved in cell wall biosynthesis
VDTDCSLLIPCYNAAAYLPRLWECIAAQQTPFAEILCYDDASKDDTAKVAQSLGATVIRGEINFGPAHARNKLLQEAAHPWVHFHDADDLMHESYLSSCAAHFTDNVDVVFCDADWLFEDSRELEISWRYSQERVTANPIGEFLNNPVGGINGTFRKELLHKIGGYDERYRCWEDADLYIRLAQTGARFKVISEALVTALRSSGSISTNRKDCWRSRLECLKSYSAWMKSEDLPELYVALERAAGELANCFSLKESMEAISLCKKLGGDPPKTNSNALSFLKQCLPAYSVFLLQHISRSGFAQISRNSR